MHHHSKEKVSFSIAYDGPGLVDGTMDVRDLAPALLSVSELYSSASRVLYGKDAEVKINVSATGNGSFEVILDLVMSTWDKIVDIFTGDSTEALERLIAIIGGAAGLFALYKTIKGRKISKVENLKDGKIAITAGSDRIEIEKNLYSIFTSPDTQIAIQKLVEEPLRHEGIEEFKCYYPEENITVTKEEASHFKRLPPSTSHVIESCRQVAFKIMSVSFRVDNKWHLSDGESSLYSEMADQEFLDKIQNSLVSFTKGDTLVCEVRTTQTVNAHGGIKSTHVIEHVIKHIPPFRARP